MFEANNIEETQPLPRTTRNQNDASITDMALLKRSAQLWEATIYKHHTPMECDPSNFASSVMRQVSSPLLTDSFTAFQPRRFGLCVQRWVKLGFDRQSPGRQHYQY